MSLFLFCLFPIHRLLSVALPCSLFLWFSSWRAWSHPGTWGPGNFNVYKISLQPSFPTLSVSSWLLTPCLHPWAMLSTPEWPRHRGGLGVRRAVYPFYGGSSALDGSGHAQLFSAFQLSRLHNFLKKDYPIRNLISEILSSCIQENESRK